MKKVITLFLSVLFVCGSLCVTCLAASVTDGENYYTAGDVNNDGSIDICDLVRMKKYIVDNKTEIIFNAADINGDNDIDSIDLTSFRKHLLKTDNSVISGGEHWTEFY